MNYIRDKKPRTNPKTMFHKDLLNLLWICRKKAERVLIVMNINENVLD